MHIFHVASGDIWAGAEVQVALLAGAQRERGYRVKAVTFAEGELATRLRHEGIETRVFDERSGTLRVWRGLRDWLSMDPPSVIHAHGYKEAILGFSAAVGLDMAKVRTLHGVPELPHGVGGTRMRIYDALDRGLARLLGVHWVAVSAPIETDLRLAFGDRVHRVSNAVSVQSGPRSSELIRLELGLGASSFPVLLYAGRLEPIKGPDILIDAFPSILREFPQAKLLVAGTGSSEEFLRQKIDELRLENNVHLLGNRRDVFDLMRAADLFVLPSRGEGMPTVLLEALASGCPVVATRVGAVAEATRDGELATLVAPERPADLADACVRLLADSTRRAAVAAAGMRDIRTRYTPARSADEMDRVYSAARNALRGRRSAASRAGAG